MSAYTTSGSWQDNYTYDGFGNLTGMTPVKGAPPQLSVGVNWQTNRITPTGVSYDNNGNVTQNTALSLSFGYDAANRLTTVKHNITGSVDTTLQSQLGLPTNRTSDNIPLKVMADYFLQ